jgi:hypothetical protein
LRPSGEIEVDGPGSVTEFNMGAAPLGFNDTVAN